MVPRKVVTSLAPGQSRLRHIGLACAGGEMDSLAVKSKRNMKNVSRARGKEWDRQGKHRSPFFYRKAHEISQRKCSQHWHNVQRAQVLSGMRDPGVWDAKVQPRITAAVSCKFEDVRHTTKHADKRARQRHIRPGTQVHTVIDDRTGTLITAWKLGKKLPKEGRKGRDPQPKLRSCQEVRMMKQQRAKKEQQQVRQGEQRLQRLIHGAMKKKVCSK